MTCEKNLARWPIRRCNLLAGYLYFTVILLSSHCDNAYLSSHLRDRSRYSARKLLQITCHYSGFPVAKLNLNVVAYRQILQDLPGQFILFTIYPNPQRCRQSAARTPCRTASAGFEGRPVVLILCGLRCGHVPCRRVSERAIAVPRVFA
jgi:hypothetical protein